MSGYCHETMVSSSEARAKRLKCMRNMIGLSRRIFCERYQLSPGTLQNWEKARFGGLTEKGAKKVIKYFNSEGVLCSFKWLMYGDGTEPVFCNEDDNRLMQDANEPVVSRSSTTQDVEHILSLHPGSVSMFVSDDAMNPLLAKGDYIVGKKHFGENIKQCCYQMCIIETVSGKRYVRLLRPTYEMNKYNLVINNALSRTNPGNIYNEELLYAAPVFWVRKGE